MGVPNEMKGVEIMIFPYKIRLFVVNRKELVEQPCEPDALREVVVHPADFAQLVAEVVARVGHHE